MRLHRLSSAIHDAALAHLCAELTATETTFPGTDLRLIYEPVGATSLPREQAAWVYFDHYTNPHYYGAVRSKDLKHWEDCSKEMKFPPGHRHGTVVRVSEHVARGLRELK